MIDLGFDHRDSTYHQFHRYRCDCGNECVKRKDRVASGKTVSCGCKRGRRGCKRDSSSRPFTSGKASVESSLYSEYKLRAKRKGLAFELAKAEFVELCARECSYCGVEPENVRQGYRYNGLDRIDNGLGYTLDNVTPCCSACNVAKGTKTVAEFYAWVDRIKRNGPSPTPD